MIGPLLVYLMLGLFACVMTFEGYVQSVRPRPRHALAYVLACVFAWPWLLWLAVRRA